MAASRKKRLDTEELRRLVPLNTLAPPKLDELAERVTVEELPRGRYLFREGDPLRDYVYLLRGAVALLQDYKEVEVVQGGSSVTRFALAHQQPRKLSGKSKTTVELIRIDSQALNSLLMGGQTSGYEVSELDEENPDDWMAGILQHWLFKKLPPAHIQQVMVRLEEIELKAGEVVIRQGDAGDYYYILKEGRCDVTRESGGQLSQVALLTVGDGFGEMALISGTPRNSTVTMAADGALLRLSGEDFERLVCDFLLRPIGYREAVRRGATGAIWIDARPADEHRKDTIVGSVNIPLDTVQAQVTTLDPKAKYTAFCNDGRLSSTVAFLFVKHGLDVCVLKDGLKKLGNASIRLLTPGERIAAMAKGDKGEHELALTPVHTEEEHPHAAGPNHDEERGPDLEGLDDEAIPGKQQVTGDLRARVGELEAERDRTLREKDKAALLRQSAEDEISNLHEQEELLRKQFEAKLRILEAELTSLRARLEKSAAEKIKNESQLQVLNEEVAKLRDERAVAATKRQEENRSLSQELEALRAKLEEAYRLQTQTADDKETLEEELERIRDAKSEQEKKLQEQIDALRADLDDAREQAQSRSGEHAAALNDRNREIHELTAQLEAAQAGAKEVQRRIDDVEAARLRAQEEVARVQETNRHSVDESRRERDELQRQFHSAQDELKQLRSVHEATAEKWTEKIRVLEERLAQANTDRDNLSRLRGEAEEQGEQGQRELERLRAELSRLETGHTEQARTLQRQVDAATAEVEQLRSEQDTQQQRTDTETRRLRTKADQLQEELSNAREREHTAEKELRTLEGKLGAARDQGKRLSEADAQLERLRVDLEKARQQAEASQAGQQQMEWALNEQVAALTRERDEALRRDEEARSMLERLREEVAADQARTQDELSTLRARLEATRSDYERALAARASEQAHLDEVLQGDLAKAREELTDSHRAREQVEADLRADLEGLRQEHERQEKGFQTTISQLQDEIREARAEQEKVAEQTAAAEQSRRDLAQEKARLTIERDELHEKLEAETARWQESLAAAEERLAASEKARDKAVARLQQGKQQAHPSGREVEALETELQVIRQQAQEDVEQLQQEIGELRANASRRAAAVEPIAGDAPPGERAAATQATASEIAGLRAELAEAVRLQEEATGALQIEKDEVERLTKDLMRAKVREQLALTGEVPREGSVSQDLAPGGEERAETSAGERIFARLRGSVPGIGSARAWVLGAALGSALLTIGLIDAVLLQAGRPEVIRQLFTDSGVHDRQSRTAGAVPKSAGRGAPPFHDDRANPSAPDKTLATTVPREEPQTPVAGDEPPPRETEIDAQRIEEFRDPLKIGGYGPPMIRLTGRQFSMGSSLNPLHRDEQPTHPVTLSDFAVGKYEVTFDAFDRFARTIGRPLPSDGGWGRGNRRPVINVSWEDAEAYARWLSQQTGHGYRLPTEAEWEFAAGAGSKSLYWWGFEQASGHANCFDCGSQWDGSRTAPVGSFDPNPFGLHDTAGNVMEWVMDCYHPSYEGAPSDGSAWTDEPCPERVARSGAYNTLQTSLRTTKREHYFPSMRLNGLGFRVARDE
jgi:formylglycine-generating enzyme required for sulfatase activity/CRP-like cAMP-binding protein/chromosome segregation ATPase/rhodanese-related sulfurtransferase